jgi:hypothetical protein
MVVWSVIKRRRFDWDEMISRSLHRNPQKIANPDLRSSRLTHPGKSVPHDNAAPSSAPQLYVYHEADQIVVKEPT